jgi:phosphoadenosine phosphosulfate reductase
MSLIDLFGENKVDVAIERLKTFEPPEGYYLAFSGGKDSVTVKALADMAGVNYDAHYNLTTVDPPELVHFIKREHPDVAIDKPLKTMWQLIVEHGVPPLRHQRYCCAELKERGGEGRVCITGIRQQESNKRSKRKMVEQCRMSGSTKSYVNPIIDWSEQEVWEFIRKYNVPYCSLYDEGWKRLGCVCCPNGNQRKQAERWHKIAEGYKRACIKAWDNAMAKGLERYGWTNGEEMYEWWISGAGSHNQEDDQTVIFE